jgi:NTP pyrophosphatase (non-canonical NTP hydrolase)
MTDGDTPLQMLKDRVLAFAAERDWQQFHSPKNLAMALAAEAAELMEHFLWSDAEASHARAADPARRAQIAEELADVLIYTLEFANVTGIYLTAAALAKLKRNAEKYPVEKARGRSEKYTEL